MNLCGPLLHSETIVLRAECPNIYTVPFVRDMNFFFRRPPTKFGDQPNNDKKGCTT